LQDAEAYAEPYEIRLRIPLYVTTHCDTLYLFTCS